MVLAMRRVGKTLSRLCLKCGFDSICETVRTLRLTASVTDVTI
jgi:hypothetical protein